jgi:hypothetical protein
MGNVPIPHKTSCEMTYKNNETYPLSIIHYPLNSPDDGMLQPMPAQKNSRYIKCRKTISNTEICIL